MLVNEEQKLTAGRKNLAWNHFMERQGSAATPEFCVQPSGSARDISGSRCNCREAIVRGPMCGTVHSKLHVARAGRALPADDASSQSSASLQYRPDNDDQCREAGRYRSRACADALGPHSGWWDKTAKEVPSTRALRIMKTRERLFFRRFVVHGFLSRLCPI
jgi:hypothetical protein